MEDLISLVFRGCKLAQELESSMGRLNGTEDLLEKCEQIAGAFMAASQGIRALHCRVATLHDHKDTSFVASTELGGGSGPESNVRPMSTFGKGKDVVMHSGGDVGGGGGGGELPLQVPFVAKGGGVGGGGGSSEVQKSRKRKDESGKRTIEVEAPLHGNTEIPPDDGFTWRKYGQKEILGALFPRSYYRCTHQRLYNCPAKKQVQRLNHNQRVFQVIYRGHHICHMSSTAPAAAAFPSPPPPPPLPPTVTSADAWLSIHLTSQPLSMMSSAATSSTRTEYFDVGGTTSLSAVVGQGELGGANVVDMADAMFNSSAGGADDGIDFIFDK